MDGDCHPLLTKSLVSRRKRIEKGHPRAASSGSEPLGVSRLDPVEAFGVVDADFSSPAVAVRSGDSHSFVGTAWWGVTISRHRPLRSHQAQVAGLVQAIARGELDGVRDILAAVTPGGGKSLLPVIAAATLIASGTVDRVVWVVPRDSLRLQAEEAFADPGWQAALGHALRVRAADNEPDPSRGLAGYVTTYQGVAAAPELHLAEMRRHRTLLVVDEVHHLPGLADYEPGTAVDAASPDEASSWSRALLPMLECARVRLLLSGTLERADGRAVLWLPYRAGPRPGTRRVDMEASGWAVVGYSRAQAVADRAVLPVTFGALDGEATWAEPLAGGAGEGERVTVGPHRLSGPHPTETTRPALFTALRTGFATELLRKAFEATRELRAKRRSERGLPAGAAARGSASCSWWPPTRPRRGPTSTCCAAGCRPSRRGVTSGSPPRRSATPTRRSRPSACCPSRRSW